MHIYLNGEQREVDGPLSIAELLQLLELDPKYLAVECNQELVPRGDHAGTLLNEGDRLEVVTLVGGG